MQIVKDLGLSCVEASADTECDPLYTTREYLIEWIDRVKAAERQFEVKVINLYSGHGTYATLGLSHTDYRIRDHILEEWLKVMVESAAKLGSGLGFFCHAFSDSVLQNLEKYNETRSDLIHLFAELAEYAGTLGIHRIATEQMYSPHQIPWTINDSQRLLREVNAISKYPFYLTIDTGHQVGQRRFLKPDRERIKEFCDGIAADAALSEPWLGTHSAYSKFYNMRRCSDENQKLRMICKILDSVEAHTYLFAKEEDGDPYIWLESLGCYSPTVHLQQTNGETSSHLPFSAEYNQKGIILGRKVLDSILASYYKELDPMMPPRCTEIYLTLEIFQQPIDSSRDILRKLRESVKYWREFVPRDGISLEHLAKLANNL